MQSPWQRARLGLARWWNGGTWQKAALIAVMPFLCICTAISSLFVFAATPYGQQLAREGEATNTAQALAQAQATATATATAYAVLHPRPTATLAPPTATATPDPRVSGPFLGGTDTAFYAVFTQTTDVVHLSGTVAGYHVQLYIAFGEGTDGRGRVRYIWVTSWDGPNDDAAAAVAKAFLPHDAHYVEDIVGTGVDNYLRHVYYSPSLAASIPADDYANDFGGTPPPPPNNAEWYCYSYYSSAPDQCVVTT